MHLTSHAFLFLVDISLGGLTTDAQLDMYCATSSGGTSLLCCPLPKSGLGFLDQFCHVAGVTVLRTCAIDAKCSTLDF